MAQEKEQVDPKQVDAEILGLGTFYRLELPVMALALKNNHRGATTIPAGETVKIVGRVKDEGFLVIDINGERFHVFDRDLTDRGRPVQTRKVRAAAHTAGS